MNRLHFKRRVQILDMLVEGVSLRGAARLAGVSTQTVKRMKRAAGHACREYHDRAVRDVAPTKVQCDESWTFIQCKERERRLLSPKENGTSWVWTAIDQRSRLLISWHVGKRSLESAHVIMRDLKSRTIGAFDLITDGCFSYPRVVDEVFQDRPVMHVVLNPNRPRGDEYQYTTNHVERHNLSMRMRIASMRRGTNAFSKTVSGLDDALALYVVHYNFCRVHRSLRVTPAMEAGLALSVMNMRDIVTIMDEREVRLKESEREPLERTMEVA